MRMIPYALVATVPLALAAITPPAFAAPECQIRVLRPVTDDVGNVWQPGKILPATIMANRLLRARRQLPASHGRWQASRASDRLPDRTVDREWRLPVGAEGAVVSR
ncbi:hypothetical protein [Paraburkholderia acidisoli]|uniref:hypothetical protein n=1 Tax=Paraburkholderia acidisoli TaxID=2571748 RepID=UPI0018EF2B89|nr:hypothetical protein [Paraburkholderia acidisoli]